MFKIKGDFIGSFTLGDNIGYNCDILNHLYKQLDNCDAGEKKYLYKPIIIIIVSIIEALLYDFIEIRITTYTREGVKNIPDNISKSIRDKKIDNLTKYICCIEKHKLFGKKEYGTLHELRKLRNRIHIQNMYNKERKVFNVTNKRKAEKMLETIVKILAEKYPRKHPYYNEYFYFPWREHS